MTIPKYIIEEVENGRYLLARNEPNNSEAIGLFEGRTPHQSAISHCLQLLHGEFQVYDLHNGVIVHMKKHGNHPNDVAFQKFEFVSRSHDKAYIMWDLMNMFEDFHGYSTEGYDIDECSTCRGGGCIHCDPHSFIDGYQDY